MRTRRVDRFDKVFSYDASKGGANAYTIHLAAELKDTPIKVNSAHPGWVKTEMVERGSDGDSRWAKT